MARNRDNETTANEPTDVVEPTEVVVNESQDVTETQGESQPTDTNESQNESQTPTETPKVDLPAVFTAAFDAGLEAAAGTEVVPEGPKAEIIAAYKNLRGKGREKAMGDLAAKMFEAVQGGQMSTAQAIGGVIKDLQTVSATPAPREKAVVDPTVELASRIVSFRTAADYLLANLPEGVTEDKLNEALAGLTVDVNKIHGVATRKDETDDQKAELKEVLESLSPVESTVLRLVSGKGTGKSVTRKASTPREPRQGDGNRRNLDELLPQIVASKPGEFLTSQAIVKAGNEMGGDFAGISSGAVANWIDKDGKSRAATVEGITVSLDPKGVTFTG